MKKLGTLYGVDLLLDTDDEKILKFAEGHFEHQRQRLEKLSDWEIELKMAEFKKKPWWKYLW